MYQPLTSINFTRGINFSRTTLAPELAGQLAAGSYNTLLLGDGYHRPFRGLSSKGAGTGSRLMRPIGKTWGGIRDVGATRGSGNVIEDIGRSLWGIGAGQVHIEGADVPFVLSTLLKLSLLENGVYQGAVTAGLSRPSAPQVGVLTESGNPNGAVTFKLEKRRLTTGGKSRASTTSAVITPLGNKCRVTFPEIGTGTHWRVFVTLMRFGGEGIHYALAYNGALDIPEAVVAAGTVDGIPRSLIFDWKDTDLVAEEASFDDYAPQAGTHLIRLENVMNVLGSFSDAVVSPTSTQTGTAIQVSKPNNYESYIPTHLLFLPEQIVDVLSRPIDSYGYVACENSIHAIQYVGYRGDELPACTITTILPDIGIKAAHNWTHFRGRIALYTAEGNALMMTESGEIDTTFANPVRRKIKDWLPENTIVGYCPKNDVLIIASGAEILAYSLETNEWTHIFLPDYGIRSKVVSCQTAQRRLYISLDDGAAYEFDAGAASNIPISFVTHYTNEPNRAGSKQLYQLSMSVETDCPDSDVIVCINRNLQQMAYRHISSIGGSNEFTSDAPFPADAAGKSVAIFAPGIGGANTHFLRGTIESVANNSLFVVDQANNAAAAMITASEMLMFIGDYIEVEAHAGAAGHVPDFFPSVSDCKSFAVGVWLMSEEVGSVLDMNVFGTVKPTSRVK